MNEDKVRIGKVEVVVNDKTFKLTLEEAEELRDALNEICPSFPDIRYIDRYVEVPIPWIYREPYRNNPYWDITYCGTTADSGILKLEAKT